MRGQLITLRYRGKEKDIDLTVRDENFHKRHVYAKNFQPYFFVEENVEIPSYSEHISTEPGFKSIFNKPLVKLVCENPISVERWRQSFSTVYESDIKFIRRFLIDRSIFNGLEDPDNREDLYFEDIKPCNFILQLHAVTLDIEVETPRRFPDIENPIYPVTAVNLHDTITDKYVSIVLTLNGEEGTEWWNHIHTNSKGETFNCKHFVIKVATEIALFEKTNSYLERVAGDIIRGWNIFFDLDYYRNRGKKLGINTYVLESYAHFDQLEGYKRIFHKASNHLKDVAIEEDLTTDVISGGWKIRRENEELFIKYGHDDVFYCVELDKKHRLTQNFWSYKTFVGLETFAPAMQHGTKVDTLMLRDAHEHGEVLPSMRSWISEDTEDETYKGAKVFDPVPGVYEGVAVFDMNRFFPSIMLAWHLSPERRDGNGIYQRVIRKLSKLRDEYDKELKQVGEQYGEDSEAYKSMKERRQNVKDALNSIYGYAGWKSSRLYNKDVASSTTQHSREGLTFIEEVVKKYGYSVNYGDTDSLHLRMPLEKCKEMETIINDALKKWCIDQGVEPLLSIKFESYYERVIYVETKGDSERGAKKYYGALLTVDGGREVYDKNGQRGIVVIKGFDRRDSSKIGRIIRKTVIEMIVRAVEPEKIGEYVASEVKKIKTGVYNLDDITKVVGIRQRLDQYKNKPNFVRGALYSNQFLSCDIEGGDTVRLLPIKRVRGLPPTDIISYINEAQVPKDKIEIDIEEIIRVTVQEKLENLLSAVNLTWARISGQRTLFSVFGTPTPKASTEA